MARIVGAIASSHTPAIGFAYDKQKQDDPVWAPIFGACRPIQAWPAAIVPLQIGESNLHIFAAMRGQSLEEFQKMRNAPGALYSVAGADAKNLDWDREPAGQKQ